MASNAPSEEIKCEESSANDEVSTITAQDGQEKENVKHCFSEPWEDSDVILVVEDEKFHVHRLILSMNSPVFKAMFKPEFKEATSNEIPLPGKKASEVLEFLKKIYGFQYINEQIEITMVNVKHLLQLSDEYQVIKHIFNPCVKFLEDHPKTKENVMKILALAELYDLEKVRQACDDLLSGMRLQTLSETVQFQNVNKDKLQHILTQRIKLLEALLDEVYPQFLGLAECSLWLWREAKKYLEFCPTHFSDGKSNTNIAERIKECEACRNMLHKMARETAPQIRRRGYEDYSDTYASFNARRYRFDERLSHVIEKFSKLMTK